MNEYSISTKIFLNREDTDKLLLLLYEFGDIQSIKNVEESIDNTILDEFGMVH